jgi:hypothetical protein
LHPDRIELEIDKMITVVDVARRQVELEEIVPVQRPLKDNHIRVVVPRPGCVDVERVQTDPVRSLLHRDDSYWGELARYGRDLLAFTHLLGLP